jgi:hypothetical protein
MKLGRAVGRRRNKQTLIARQLQIVDILGVRLRKIDHITKISQIILMQVPIGSS